MNSLYICMPLIPSADALKRAETMYTNFLKAEEESALTTVDMRDWVKSAYPGPNWKKKVDKMSDDQIIALYYSLVKRGKIKN